VLVARKAQHPRVGVLFDPAHYYTTPTKFDHLNPDTVPWIKHVHLDGMRDKPGDLSHCNDDRVLPGQGILDLPALIARLEEHGYAGYFSIEMFNHDLWQLPAAEAARRCYESLLPLCQ
jgi:sugar phosphate isomerase/epimerase